MPDSPWTLTEDAWCDLCLLVIELGMTTQHVQALLLAPDRPALQQVEQTAEQLQTQMDDLLGYLRTHLRVQVDPTDVPWQLDK